MKVLVFARLRDLLGAESVQLTMARPGPTVQALREQLQEQVGGEFAQALDDPNVFCAVNQRVVDNDAPVSASDEVAFFPPMTGG